MEKSVSLAGNIGCIFILVFFCFLEQVCVFVWVLGPGVCVLVLCAEYHAMVPRLRIRGNVASVLNRHAVIADHREGALRPTTNA